MTRALDELLAHTMGLEIVDTHEHLPGMESARVRETDVLQEYLADYFNRDLMSAGLSPAGYRRVVDHTKPLMERWRLVEPFWEVARHTGYGRALDITARDLYGVERICRGTIEDLNAGFMQSLKPGHWRWVLKDKSRIRVSVIDSSLDCDRSLFRSVYRLDQFIYPRTRTDVRAVEAEAGVRICALDDWLEACEAALDAALQKGAVALKCGLAYRRALRFERRTLQEADEGFNGIFENLATPEWEEQVFTVGRAFQDYMMHYVLRLANKRHLTFQFHTGLQEGNGSIVSQGDPALLSNLFLEYPDVDFDLLHMGYPYQQTLSALAKVFPNVYIDMCWAHIISPTACVNALAEWVDTVPLNKISAFGGDYSFVDAVYGHQVIARQNVSKALARQVEEGTFDVDRAKEIATMLFLSNPLRILKLEQDADTR